VLAQPFHEAKAVDRWTSSTSPPRPTTDETMKMRTPKPPAILAELFLSLPTFSRVESGAPSFMTLRRSVGRSMLQGAAHSDAIRPIDARVAIGENVVSVAFGVGQDRDGRNARCVVEIAAREIGHDAAVEHGVQ